MATRAALGSETFQLTARMGHGRWLDIIGRCIDEGLFRIGVRNLGLGEHLRFKLLVKATQDDWRDTILRTRKAAEVPKADETGSREDDDGPLFVSDGEDNVLERVTEQTMLDEVADMVRTMVDSYMDQHPHEFRKPKTGSHHRCAITAAFFEAIHEVQHDRNGHLRRTLLGPAIRKVSVESGKGTKRATVPTYSEAQKIQDQSQKASSKASHLAAEAQAIQKRRDKTINDLSAQLEATRLELEESEQNLDEVMDMLRKSISAHEVANTVARKAEQCIADAEARAVLMEQALVRAERRAASAEEAAKYYEVLEARARGVTKEWMERYFARIQRECEPMDDAHEDQKHSEKLSVGNNINGCVPYAKTIGNAESVSEG